jgi:hypothetical protein
LLFLLVLPCSANAGTGLLNPGRWEITLQTVSPITAPPIVTEACISKEDAEVLPEPPKSKSSDDCQATGALHGKSLKYKTKCNRRNVTSDVDLTFNGDTYEGIVTITVDGREIRQAYTAKRLGDCPVE